MTLTEFAAAIEYRNRTLKEASAVDGR